MTRAISPVSAIGALLILSSPASAQAVREGKIRILGRATIEAVPDSANVTIGVANKASNATVALDQNSRNGPQRHLGHRMIVPRGRS